MRFAPQMPLAWMALALAALVQGCLPGERANDPLPDVSADAAKTDAAKTDAKADAAKTDGAADAADSADDTTQTADAVIGDDVTTLGCKSDDDCLPLLPLPCHATPTCEVTTGLCESGLLDADTPCSVDACQIGQKCDATGTCTGGTAMSCDDKNDCTFDSCAAGVCAHASGDFACSDKNGCTLNDHCANNVCVGTARNCDDANPCTTDKCTAATGLCQSIAIAYDPNAPVACAGNPVGTLAFCDAGACGAAPSCDDKNPCTSDNFNPSTLKCESTFVGTASCGTDKCHPGTCTLVASLPTCVTKTKCDDGNPCTIDSCDSNGNCAVGGALAKEPAGTACTSPDPCIGSGQCDGKTTCKAATPVVCNDGNPCTDDSCLSGTGCIGTPNSKACNDGNACTTSDACSGGLCGGTPAVQDDGNSCTADACDPIIGVTHTIVPDGQSCGSNATCSKGICVAQ